MIYEYLITGSEGFVGANLINSLTPEQFISFDKRRSSRDNHLTYDLTTSLPEINSNVIIHLAAQTDVRHSLKVPKSTIAENCLSTLQTLQLAKLTKAKFIFASSIGAPQALSPYSASKLACESFCSAYISAYGLDIKILRFSNIYGPHSLHKSSVIARFIKDCLSKRPLVIFGDGNQTRDFIHVSDVIEAILNPPDSKLARVCSGKPISIKNLAKMIQEISEELTGFKPNIIHEEAIKGEVLRSEPISDFTSTILLQDGLLSTFEWFLENVND